jgi:hypothetical protein
MTLRKIINSDSGLYSSSKGKRAITMMREKREKKQKKKETLVENQIFDDNTTNTIQKYLNKMNLINTKKDHHL